MAMCGCMCGGTKVRGEEGEGGGGRKENGGEKDGKGER